MDSIVVCNNCGARNRVKSDRQGKKPVCGRCRNVLPRGGGAPHRVVEITDRTFEQEVKSFPGPVVINCWAPRCAACRQVVPILDGLAKEYGGKVKIAKLNVDQNQRTASRFDILSIPTFLFFKNGVHVDTVTGAVPKAEMERHISALLH